MPTALLIAYYFPPIQAVGGFRTLRFAKFLPEFDWKPVVFTASPDCVFERVDPTLLQSCPQDLSLRRIRAFDPIKASGRFIGSLRRLAKTGRSVAASTGTSGPNGEKHVSDTTMRQSGASRLGRWYGQCVRTFLCTPDPKIWWVPKVIPAAWRAIRSQSPDVLYTTGPPHSTHLIGFILRHLTGLPWVADFRDPWARCPWSQDAHTWRNRLDSALESACVRHAAAVVLNTDAAAQEFASHYADLPKSKFVSIPNGYDPDLREVVSELQRFELRAPRVSVTRLCHAGDLYGQRSLLPIVDAIGILTREGRRIELSHYGDCDQRVTVLQRIDQLGLERKVVVHPCVPHREALRQLARSDVLVAIQPGTALQIPSKIYEMMLFHQPILLIGESGATSQLILENGLGTVVSSNDPDAIADAIRSIDDSLTMNADGRRGRQEIDKFDGRYLTGRLADIFDSVRRVSGPREVEPLPSLK